MTEWGSVVEWVQLGVMLTLNLLIMGFLVWYILTVTRRSGDFIAGVFGSGTATMRDGRPTIKSIFCKHRVLAHVRNAYGRNYTACCKCGVDVNRGKSKEEWR